MTRPRGVQENSSLKKSNTEVAAVVIDSQRPAKNTLIVSQPAVIIGIGDQSSTACSPDMKLVAMPLMSPQSALKKPEIGFQ